MSSVYITDYVSNPNIEKNSIKNANFIQSFFLLINQKINSSYLDQFPNLEGIVRYGVGIDQLT